MKLILSNSSGKNIWAMASSVDIGVGTFIMIEFALTGDPIDGDLPEPIPAPPKCIVVEIPEVPIQYLVPEGYTFKSSATSVTAPDGDNGIMIDIADVVQIVPEPPKGLPN